MLIETGVAKEPASPDSIREESGLGGRNGAAWALLLVIGFGVALRLVGLDWLLGTGLQADFSFHPDDDRFVRVAKSFHDYPPMDGYVLGMATQLFVALSSAKLLGVELNAILTLRGITLLHAAFTIALTYSLSMAWFADRRRALLASLLVAFCPLHLVNSHFGTADVAVISLFYATMLAAGHYLRTASYAWFTVMIALCGFTIAVKFFIPLLFAMAALILTERADRRWSLSLTAAFVLAGSFSMASFFNYTPWDFAALMRMIMYDNVSIIDGKSPYENAYLYAWRLIPALGLPVAALAAYALVRFLGNGVAPVRSLLERASFESLRGVIRSPGGLLAIALIMHGLMIITAGVSSIRHLLIYVPVLCIAAASAFGAFADSLRVNVLGRAVGLILLVGYLTWNAIGLQFLYLNDVRSTMADWTDKRVQEGARVYAASFYTPVKGARYERDLDVASIAASDYFLTCELEYERYLTAEDAESIYHAKGGQPRVDFYRGVFLGDSRFQVVQVFRQQTYTFEQRLIASGWLPRLDTFTPAMCMALGEASTMPRAAQRAILDEAKQGVPTI